MTKDEALKLALEALACTDSEPGSRAFEREEEAITAIKEALAQPEQEPVAYFDWLPKEATHIARIKVKTRSGGRLEMGAYVFKYDNEVLMVYTTDNDNEYPGWREAKQCFYHLNFPVFPIPTTPPQRPWVGLTDEEIESCANWRWMTTCRAIEAKLKEKNT